MVVSTLVLTLITITGFFVVPPNVTRVLIFFGKYRGTVRKEGFYWTNPFTSKKAVSVKAYNVASDKIKVNDLLGNPIEVGAIVVWEVADTAQALFDVEGYEEYVDVQIEGAVRQVTSKHPYDDDQAEVEVVSLRGGSDVIAIGVLPDHLGELQELNGDIERDLGGRHALQQRGHLRLLIPER